MIKKILCVTAVIVILGISGCDLVSKAMETTTTTTPATVEIVREAKIGQTWVMKQMEIDLETAVPIVLTLKDGDNVQGYFYLLKGDGIDFTIAGISPIYTSPPTDDETGLTDSDRFAFTANQGEGVAYKLTLDAGTDDDGNNNKATVFLEIIYPATGSMLVPIGTK
jgi:hypothetical protein